MDTVKAIGQAAHLSNRFVGTARRPRPHGTFRRVAFGVLATHMAFFTARLSAVDPGTYVDGFEAASIGSFWTQNTQNTEMSLQSTVVHGGSQAVKFNSTTSGQKECQLTHIFTQDHFGKVSAWVYDAKTHIYFSVTAYATNTSVASIGVQDWDYSAYYSVGGKTTVARTVGWHKFTLEVGETGLRTLIDDQVVYTAAGGKRFNKVELSLKGPSSGTTYAYYDDFLFESWLKPEIGLIQPGGTPVADGGSWDAGMCFVGTPMTVGFGITNTGEGELSGIVGTIDGPEAAEFSAMIPAGLTVPSGGSANIDVIVNVATGGGTLKTAALHLTSNDSDESPYDIALAAGGLSPSDDSDSDGMNDVAEFKMSAQGFAWDLSQPALVSNLMSNAHHCGLFTEGHFRNLHVGVPLVGVSNATVNLQLQLQKSDDLKTWTSFGGPVQWSEPASGKAFYRLFFDGGSP